MISICMYLSAKHLEPIWNSWISSLPFRFSLQDGIDKVRHCFPDHGKIPLGFKFTGRSFVSGRARVTRLFFFISKFEDLVVLQLVWCFFYDSSKFACGLFLLKPGAWLFFMPKNEDVVFKNAKFWQMVSWSQKKSDHPGPCCFFFVCVLNSPGPIQFNSLFQFTQSNTIIYCFSSYLCH